MSAVERSVLVVGDGIAGHLIAIALQENGFPTILLDAGSCASSSATLRNEGWLHRGTYHAVSQADEAAALSVATRCQRGSEHLRSHFAAALERTDARSLALIHETVDSAFVLERWALCGIDHRALTPAQVASLLPEVDASELQRAFVVSDQPIHTGRLLSLARRRFAQLGGTVRSGRATAVDAEGLQVCHAGTTEVLRPWLTIWAAGYSGFELVAPLLPPDVHARYWRSHLMLTEPLTSCSWFEVQPGGLGLMDHGTHAVVGLNEDVQRIAPSSGRVDRPDAAARRAFADGIERLLGAPAPEHSQVVPCTKIDLVAATSAARDVNVRATFLRPGLLLALPGKMTEAPVLANDVLALVLDATHADALPARLGDRWVDARTLLSDGPFHKAPLTETADSVIKIHSSAAPARFEARVAGELAAIGARVPAVRVADLIGGTSTVAYERIAGTPLPEVRSTPELVEASVRELVRWQRHFQIGASPLGLYRDAMAANLLVDGARLWNVDLSSSNQIRHHLDDLALLALSSGADPEVVVATYRAARRSSWSSPGTGSGVVAGLAEVGFTFADMLDAAYRTYEQVVSSMPAADGWDPERALDELAAISFLELRWADLPWFLAFRSARIRHLSTTSTPVEVSTR